MITGFVKKEIRKGVVNLINGHGNPVESGLPSLAEQVEHSPLGKVIFEELDELFFAILFEVGNDDFEPLLLDRGIGVEQFPAKQAIASQNLGCGGTFEPQTDASFAALEKELVLLEG